MAYLGARSLLMSSSCTWDVQRVIQEAIKEIDFSVICGHRDKKNQTMAHYSKTSNCEWPNSRHNSYPSEAFDFIPCPFTSWKDTERFEMVAKVIKAAAVRLGIEVECGADWKMKDMGHVEIKQPKN